METIARVTDLLDRLDKLPDNPRFLNKKTGKEWRALSTRNFLEQVHALAFFFLELGLKKGDRISILSPNKPEWLVVDFACQKAGLILVPLFPSISVRDFNFILNHAGCRIVFFGNVKLLDKFHSHVRNMSHIEQVYLLDEEKENFLNLAALLEKGRSCSARHSSSLAAIHREMNKDDIAYILYTSGTSGDPKGVLLSHGNMASITMACRWVVPIKPHWKTLSFLPLNHVYEHTVNLIYFYHNISIYFIEHLETIGDAAREVKPDFLVAVPRIIERVYERIHQKAMQLPWWKKKLFTHSIRFAEKSREPGENALWHEIIRKIFYILVYSKWKAALGGNVKHLVSGGAALNPKLCRVFSCAEIIVQQGYGLTEASGIISVNLSGKGKQKFGTVGPVVDGCQVRISPDDGEILVKGPTVMKGYYKNQEATREAIDEEGWLHTGDVGEWVDGKFLKITDRKKEIFKTSAGKYIAPAPLENKLKECPFIENCIVLGEYQKFPTAIIIPNMTNFKEHCSRNKLEPTEELLCQLIQNHIQWVNRSLADFEKLKRCRIVHDTWGIESGELTPKLSLKRRIIKEKYKKILDEIYQKDVVE